MSRSTLRRTGALIAPATVLASLTVATASAPAALAAAHMAPGGPAQDLTSFGVGEGT